MPRMNIAELRDEIHKVEWEFRNNKMTRDDENHYKTVIDWAYDSKAKETEIVPSHFSETATFLVSKYKPQKAEAA